MPPVWVVDTSSLIQIKSEVSHAARDRVFDAMTALVHETRLMFPREVLAELKRDSDNRHPDRPLVWAISVETEACKTAPTFDEVKAVLAAVPDVIDPAKESGVDEADPYVLALARPAPSRRRRCARGHRRGSKLSEETLPQHGVWNARHPEPPSARTLESRTHWVRVKVC